MVSITAALKNNNIPLHAQSVLQMLIWAGHVEEVEYPSSTGSGEIKKYQRLTDTGLKFGANMATLSPTKTEIKIDPTVLPIILQECHRGFSTFLAAKK